MLIQCYYINIEVLTEEQLDPIPWSPVIFSIQWRKTLYYSLFSNGDISLSGNGKTTNLLNSAIIDKDPNFCYLVIIRSEQRFL